MPHINLTHLLSFALLSLFIPACGGSVTLERSSGGSSSGGQSSSSSSSSSSGSSGSVQCGQTYDRLDIKIQDPKGQEYSCTGMLTNPNEFFEITGELLSQQGNTLVIETCPPTADCPSIPYSIHVDAADLYLNATPKGTYLTIRADIRQDWACVQRLLILNAPSWAGVPNPTSTEEFIWFAGADGTTDVLPGTPFVIESPALGCYPETPPDCGQRDDHQLEFMSTIYEDHHTIVSMGNTTQWSPKNPDGRLMMVRNLRAYVSGACDDYWNWAYWMAFPPTVD